ncbi:hypothetical protein TorRG33x02_239410 [Trema orientale]|uniref:Uncharacterized protein n=1 Tax=Trema orientale TaxID=63057 RepID=A0A2P5DX09_TREOI|nr:hypothetical protein TorRG33x02_239410 [Trema orientale]
MLSLIPDLEYTNQKNQVKAEETVSRVARIKVRIMSRRNSGDCPEISFPINWERKSSPLSLMVPSILERMMLSANRWTVVIDSFRRLSEPNLKNLFSFHKKGERYINLMTLILEDLS